MTAGLPAELPFRDSRLQHHLAKTLPRRELPGPDRTLSSKSKQGRAPHPRRSPFFLRYSSHWTPREHLEVTRCHRHNVLQSTLCRHGLGNRRIESVPGTPHTMTMLPWNIRFEFLDLDRWESSSRHRRGLPSQIQAEGAPHWYLCYLSNERWHIAWIARIQPRAGKGSARVSASCSERPESQVSNCGSERCTFLSS